MGAGAGRGAGQLARAVPSGTGMGLPAAVRDRVAAAHRSSTLPERLRLYDGWAARYEQLHRRGFRCLHGVDGSAGMLERARSTGLYQELRLCVLGREPLPAPAEHYDAVTVVGALGEGQVPSTVLPELLRVTKPGGFLCLTTRSNPSNLRYKAELEAALGQLEQSGAWQKLLAQEVEYWERATTEEESTQGTGYISGVVYIYQKCPVPHLEEG
ncbi:methyltransferase-like protein 27 isoform X2 [Pyrgilauda ruficollis]|uniref:methyltransferase-like protein 27 isoform X2 n=1 Tax=Pyrgilauda ruficollis TaxID=221976 RepID=UPI001B87CED6|nr:methyltransferase-like protein 27 isoform X2 [Pyrgilauda ruficollis]